MSPLTQGQRRQAGIMASLGGSGVEECTEATVDLHLQLAPSLSFSSVFTQESPDGAHRSHLARFPSSVSGCGRTFPVGRSWALTHLSVSVADGLSKGAPSLSVLHLHWCIVGQQQVGTFCTQKRTSVGTISL